MMEKTMVLSAPMYRRSRTTRMPLKARTRRRKRMTRKWLGSICVCAMAVNRSSANISNTDSTTMNRSNRFHHFSDPKKKSRHPQATSFNKISTTKMTTMMLFMMKNALGSSPGGSGELTSTSTPRSTRFKRMTSGMPTLKAVDFTSDSAKDIGSPSISRVSRLGLNETPCSELIVESFLAAASAFFLCSLKLPWRYIESQELAALSAASDCVAVTVLLNELIVVDRSFASFFAVTLLCRRSLSDMSASSPSLAAPGLNA
mmetsp:Transcript_56289/g.132006  ORF Transcript_56289/g.132006 Transcript_56289/m.132006 type:complete len:259 (-) Transcript_56289:524-1300(-)